MFHYIYNGAKTLYANNYAFCLIKKELGCSVLYEKRKQIFEVRHSVHSAVNRALLGINISTHLGITDDNSSEKNRKII